MGRRSGRRLAVILLAAALVTGVVVAVSDGGGGDLDRPSYQAGYDDAFGGAYIPSVQGSRQDIEHDCDTLYGKMASMYGGKEIVRADWVQGCADAAQNKDSRFK
ncbi:hypothetical protein [Streptomyces microflavus]|uniref:hypothetical protein n=1 Tax=Streptomyces microflavus TaxID=1919 RepID=UPI0033A6E77B